MNHGLQPSAPDPRVLSVSAGLEIVFRKGRQQSTERNAESLPGEGASTLTCNGETQVSWTELNEWRARS
jgi:hypothetical protein